MYGIKKENQKKTTQKIWKAYMKNTYKEKNRIRKQIIPLVPRICVVQNNALTCNGTCGLNLKEVQQIKALSIISKNFVGCVMKFYSTHSKALNYDRVKCVFPRHSF